VGCICRPFGKLRVQSAKVGGCTLLRIVSGLIAPTTGSVLIGDEDVTTMPPEQRNVGLVPQIYALFPHLSVFDNVAYPLKLRQRSTREIEDLLEAVLDMVELLGLKRRKPEQLSGGQQQRVALARAIVFHPNVLLMDEPLGALDKRLREQLQIELRKLQRELNITTIYVTHDQEEAFTIESSWCCATALKWPIRAPKM
jgi:putative spermidine/putrescine transport system ATP-binding protein